MFGVIAVRGEHTAPPSRRRRLARLRTTPEILLAGTIAIALLAVVLATTVSMLTSSVNGGLAEIGNRDAPEVEAATGLYFSLNDMDAQVANVLLAGNSATLAATRAQDLSTYRQDSQNAGQDLQRAVMSSDGIRAQRELSAALNGMGDYEGLAAQAILTDQQSASPAGQPSAAALGFYRQATDLMSATILPDVAALTQSNTAGLDATYAASRDRALTGIVWVLVLGLLLTAALAGAQVILTRRCRRMLNPALALATALAVGFTVTAATVLGAEAGHLKVAKQEAFDSIVALSQARAVSYDANADESRYLVDMGRAVMYQNAFLAESQLLAYVGNVGIFQYDGALASDIAAQDRNNANVRFGGYLGAEFRNITFPGERAAARRTLLAYQVYERDDRVLRALARTSRAKAIAFDTGTAPGQSDWAFDQYDAALSSVIAINSRAFTAAVRAGTSGTDGWTGLIPAACALLVIGLAIAGVRPRLAEYRLRRDRTRGRVAGRRRGARRARHAGGDRRRGGHRGR